MDKNKLTIMKTNLHKMNLKFTFFILFSLFWFSPHLFAAELNSISATNSKKEKKLYNKALSLNAEVEGYNISIDAESYTLPKRTKLSVKLLSDKEKQHYINELLDSAGIDFEKVLAFDITLYDTRGNEIQPEGEVRVGFSGIDLGKGSINVVHVEENNIKDAKQRKYLKKEINTTVNHNSLRPPGFEKKAYLKSAGNEQDETIYIKTSHFSVYLVGTVNTATYNFYSNSVLVGTQIVVDGESLTEPNTPETAEGKRFTGWFINGTKVNFNTPLNVSTTQIYDVAAKFEDVFYVKFIYNGSSIATKHVTPNTTTDASGVPLLVTDVGKAFTHWSLTPGGSAFNFNTPITQDTKLFTVLDDLWTVSFVSQGGTVVAPTHVVDNDVLGNVEPTTKLGYTFIEWNTTPDGTGTTYNSSSTIDASLTLYAIWSPKNNTQYTIAYWQQNPNNDDYTYIESVVKTGTSGTTAVFDGKNYTGFVLNAAKTVDDAIIKGNGSTIVNVYYDRKTYTLQFYEDLAGSQTKLLQTYSNLRYGQNISEEWDKASGAYPQFLWATTNNGNTYYSATPAMPNKNLSVYGSSLGNFEYKIEYRENVAPHNEIKTAFTFNASNGMQLTSEDYIYINGFTFDSQQEDFDSDRKAVLYYKRNEYNITFIKNDNNAPTAIENIPFESDISDKALPGYVAGVTKRYDGFTFAGWFTTEEALEGSEFTFDGKSMPENSLILYAKWENLKTVVRAHVVLEPPFAQGGSNFVTINVPYGGTVSPSDLNEIAEIPAGYTIENDFLGWYWYVGNSFVVYDFDLEIYSDIEVFPVWRMETYNIFYNLNGGSGIPPEDNCDYLAGAGAVVRQLSAGVNPPSTDKVFTGWENPSNGNMYYPHNEIIINENITLNAKWGNKAPLTDLRYRANSTGGGNDIVLEGLIKNTNHTVQTNTFTNNGYTFAGWNTKSDGSGTYFKPGDQIVVGSNESAGDNILFACWARVNLNKKGVFNDENSNGKAEAGETITYTFTVQNTGLVPLNNITIDDPKLTVSGNPLSLQPGATSAGHFYGTYTLGSNDLTEGMVENSATVTGYTPNLEIPVTSKDNNTVTYQVCFLEISCPASFESTVECLSDVPAAASAVAELESLGFTINDYCGTLNISSNDVSDGNSNPETITRTYTIFDDLNNDGIKDANEEEITCDQIITIDDEQNPTITAPEDVTVECDEIPEVGNATATDNCDTDLTITYDGEIRTDGDCANSYSLVRSWTATDNYGNSSSESQTITVVDNTAPELTVPADLTVECDAIPEVGTASATDNCDSDVTVTYDGQTRTDGDCANSYTLVRSWTATDDCGNSSTLSQTITVNDNTAPELTVPADLTVECDAIPEVGTASATDNCDSDVTVTYDGQTRTDGDCANSYTLVRSWTATDDCGNSSTLSQTITVNDNTAPELTVPADLTVECDAIPEVGTASATDNCDSDVTVTYDGQTRTDGDCANSYTLVRSWTATDDCGNSSTLSQTITVNDNTAPELTVPADLTVECDAIPEVGTASATDNCDENIVVTYDGETRTDGECEGSYTLTRTWTATDNCGNETSASQTISVSDNTAPELTVPADVNAECSSIPEVGTASATDNCDENVVITYDGETRTDGECEGSYTLTRTWTATDNCGNETSASQTISVSDNTAPELTVPADVNAECSSIPEVGTASATDNCDENVVVTYDGETRTDGECEGSYTLTRTWTATDNCGNETSASQTISVSDNTAPELSVPADASAECSSIPEVGTASATDNCDENIVVTYDGETRTDGECEGSYTLTRTWTATDNCGNETSASQTISVSDNTAPELTVPADVNAECSSIPEVGTASATDNCDENVVITYDGETRTDGECEGSYTLTRTWTATDNCGNETSASQTITVSDNTAPQLTVPADATAECSSIPEVGTASATDNCDENVVITYDGETRTDGECEGSYTLTRTWTATDNCGNETSASQTISVSDNTAPELTVPADVNAECSSIPEVGTASATDNCDENVVITYDGETRTDGECEGSYTLTRTWTATDNCGNETSASQTISVSDNTAPELTVPADVNAECSSIPEVGTASATDNCDENVVVTYDGETRTDGECEGSYTLTRTWTATDNCGNETSASQTISVSDNTAPELSVPADASAECSSIPEVGTASATDNCDENVVITYDGETRTDGECEGSYTLTRTWTATDNCGNETSASQTISVSDNTAPELSVPADVTAECSSIPEVGTASATDNCDENVVVTYNGETRTNGECEGSYTLTRTWTATDNCGNETSASQTISVSDNTAPELSVPADVTAECSSIPEVGTASATDNCDENVVVTYDGETRTDGECEGSYTLTRTWTATDNCGNETSASQTISVSDNTAPELTVPADVTAECSSIPEVGTASATDNCDENVVVTYDGETRTDGECEGSYTLTRTWTATDNCGNETSASQTIAVSDNTAPELTVPADVTAECSSIPEVGTASATDNCDQNVVVTYDGETRTDGECEGSYTLTRTWTATDNCGNETSASQTISVSDNTAPELSVPADVSAECSSIPEVGTASATDNCDENVVVTYDGETRTDGECEGSYTLTRTWTATDNCGNETSASQTIAVSDNTAPELTVPADVSAECSSIPEVGTASATDNCDENVVVTYDGETRTDGECEGSYTLTRTWTATDNCGNETSASQTITVSDITAPELSVPADATAECSSIPEVGTASATDNCDENVVVTYDGETRTDGECEGSYTLTRTWTATDNCGNETSASQTITVSDNTAPEISCPETLELTSSVNALETINAWLVSAVATDNCDNEVTVTTDFNEADLDNNNELTVTFTATDDCGNSNTCQSTIISVDNPPEINCHNITVYLYENGEYVLSARDLRRIATVSDDNTATENIIVTAFPRGFECIHVGTDVRVTVTATDNSGNSSSCVTMVTVLDTIAPVAICKDKVTLYLDENGTNSAVPGFINDGNDRESVPAWARTFNGLEGGSYDACGIASSYISKLDYNCSDAGVNTVVLTVVDAHGNEGYCYSQVTVLDTIAPVIECHDTTLYLDGNGQASIDAADLIKEMTDECSINEVTASQNEFNHLSLGENQVLVTVTDPSGNSTECVSTVTIIDNIAPAATCVDQTIYLDENGQANIDATEVIGNAAEIIDLDTFFISKSSFGCADLGTNEVTLTSIDFASNQSTCIAQITVIDSIAPVVICKDSTVNVDSGLPVSLGLNSLIESMTDNCGIQETAYSINSLNCDNIGMNEIVVTITDASGNVSECIANVELEDNTAPVVICPANIDTVIVTSECEIELDVPAPAVSDDCNYSLANNISSNENASGIYPVGITTVVWTATDNSGNETICEQLITVKSQPIAVNDEASTSENQSVTFDVLENDTDCDSNIVASTLEITVQPGNGTVSVENGSLTYIPAEGYSGMDTLKYSVCDEDGLCSEASVFINTGFVNDAPVAMNDEIITGNCVSVTFDVLLNDMDNDGDELTDAVVVTGVSNGTLTQNTDGTFEYTPNPGFIGDDSFIYQVCDNVEESVQKCAEAEVVITVKLDTDCDGVPNDIDIDDDNDGILDTDEGITVDTDNDGIPNNLDIDSDNDGILDNIEAQPEGTYYAPLWSDADGDGWDDAYDPDNGGTYNVLADTDNDGTPDFLDLDTDDDDNPDYIEGFDVVGSLEGKPDSIPDIAASLTDTDGDGLDDSFDNINGWSNFENPVGGNAPLPDYDGDKIRDWRDNNDGKPTTGDNGQLQPEPEGCAPKIPDGFSPDGNNINDNFEIVMECEDGEQTFEEVYPDAKLLIYNRWGNLIYEKEGYGNTTRWGLADAWWNGSSQNDWTVGSNKVPVATYIYILILEEGNVQKGTVFVNY